MTKIIGIIPAGGSAYRFQGLAKELLPVSSYDCALSRCVKAMKEGGAEDIYIATRQDKTVEHWRAVEQIRGVNLTARPFADWWKFVKFIGENYKADRYLFAMADTVFPSDTFCRKFPGDLTAGVFQTDKPGRFGIITPGDYILDKDPKAIGIAWGVWIWSRRVMEAIIADPVKDSVDGLNNLIAQFDLSRFEMEFYYDFAAFDDYVEFLCNLT